ncbi:MAG: ATP synthase F0 subunit B [Chloroflexi bacterium 44-23]|nr:MAG: ATP synthase F0 subunit B [Chloroflexi bacterium 44-23]
MEKLGLNLGFLLIQILSFFIILIVLKAWMFEPMIKMLEERRKKIAQGLEDARIAADARANAEEAADKIIGEAQGAASGIIKEATSRAEILQKEIMTEAEKGLERERSNALAEVEEERVRLLSEMRGDVSAIAIAAAQKLIGETLDQKRQQALLKDFFSGVKDGKVTILEGSSINGNSVEVTSALPLTSDEQEQVKNDIVARNNKPAEISFRVDPSILGGIILRVGDQILDGSVVAQLGNLQKSLR